MIEEAPTTGPSPPTPHEPPSPTPPTRVLIEAIYQDGVIKPLAPLDLPPDTPMLLEITTRVTLVAELRANQDNGAVEVAAAPPAIGQPLRTGGRRALRDRLALAPEALRRMASTANLIRLGLLMVALALGVATRLFAGDGMLMLRPAAATAAWVASIALVIAACRRPDSGEALAAPGPPWSRLEVAGVLGLFVAALLARVLWNDSIPGALYGDEGGTGLAAVQFLDGRRNNLFAMGWYSFPSLFFTLPATAIAALGRTYGALRTPSALAGALTVVGVYWFARPLFGRMTAALSAVLLAALAFHVHFSRIGLNNIWDGVFLVFIFGLFWRGWQTERRWYFNAAGVMLGLSQYFYSGARLIPLILLGWLALAFVTDWRRARRHSTNIVSMFLVALVVVLPLSLFYLKHPEEFAAPFSRVSRLIGYSEGKDWFRTTSQATHKSVVQLVLENYRDAALGFVLLPLHFYYNSGTPMLLALPAVLFALGAALALYNLRDPRYWLILLVLIGIMSVSVVTHDTPAAQRYIIAAPMATLLAGLALATLAGWAARAWPRARLIIYAAVIALMLIGAGRELEFYFLEYTPTRGYGSPNDEVASSLARYLERYPPGSQVFFFGAPRVFYHSYPTLEYLDPQVQGTDVVDVLTAPPDWTLSGARVGFVFLPERSSEAKLVEHRYPGGSYQWITNQDHRRLYLLYELR